MGLTLGSTSFSFDSSIPSQFTCDGSDISPELSWENTNNKTKSYVLIVDDPDAPAGIWVHWVIFNIPANVTHLAEGSALPAGAVSGKNSWGTTGYRGPCPPSGTHRYIFRMYALDSELNLTSSATKQDVMKAMHNHILTKGEYIGLYSKQ